MEKKEIIQRIILIGYAFCLFEWFLSYQTFIVAYTNNFEVLLKINQFNEALFEFILMPIFSIIAVIGLVYFTKLLIFGEEEEKTEYEKFLDQQIDKSFYSKKRYGAFFFLACFIGFFFADFVLRLINWQSVYIEGIQLHHIYLGFGGFIFFSIFVWKIERLTVNQNIIFIMFAGFCFGIGLHDVYLHIFFFPFNFTYEIDYQTILIQYFILKILIGF